MGFSLSWARRRRVFPTGKLRVTVLKAKGIKGDEKYGLGKADPVGILKLGGRDTGVLKAETRVHKDGGSNPEWNQVFTFPIMKNHEEYNELTIQLLNKNWWKDNTVGEISFKNMQKDLNWSGNMVPEKWYDVMHKEEKRGEIRLSFDFIPIIPSRMLAETNVVMGDASDTDYLDGDGSSDDDSAAWKTWARLACGLAKTNDVDSPEHCTFGSLLRSGFIHRDLVFRVADVSIEGDAQTVSRNLLLSDNMSDWRV